MGKLNSIADIFADPHFRARGNLLEMEEEGLGKVVIPGVVPTLSETPGRVTNLGPRLGEATYEVMRELLDLTAAGDRQPAPAAHHLSSEDPAWISNPPRTCP